MNTIKHTDSRAEMLGFFIYNLNLLPVVVIGEYFFNEDGIPPIYLPSRCGYRSTEKIGSQQEKLSLKAYKIPRVGLDKKFGSPLLAIVTISHSALASTPQLSGHYFFI
ncbi:MAG: hypothetical protein J5762_01675 [Clostridia bacterium]|nr:hypothetical protein [Clostridia bacterium]